MSRRGTRCFCGLVSSLLVLGSLGCGGQDAKESLPKANLTPQTASAENADEASREAIALAVQLQADEANANSPAAEPENLYPEVLISTSLGDMRVRLNAKDAPQTVRNFLVDYVDRGFYDETIVHYVDSGFMIAAGGYDRDFKAKAERTAIRHEGKASAKNLRGTLAMVRHAEYIHSATSQFLINLADNPSLDYQELSDGGEEARDPASYGYCVFGQVVEGLDVLDRIGSTPVTDKAEFPRTPTTPVVIRKITRVR